MTQFSQVSVFLVVAVVVLGSALAEGIPGKVKAQLREHCEREMKHSETTLVDINDASRQWQNTWGQDSWVANKNGSSGSGFYNPPNARLRRINRESQQTRINAECAGQVGAVECRQRKKREYIEQCMQRMWQEAELKKALDKTD